MKKLLYLIICVIVFATLTGSISRRMRLLAIDTGGLSYTTGDALLLEDGSADVLLLEIGDRILVE